MTVRSPRRIGDGLALAAEPHGTETISDEQSHWTGIRSAQ